ncbi:hypothetical protein [Jeotgalibacillus soli]|uniref:hypothetical protein n=1 Tax=Jeotgalibacillus soli TaxID=889306 RepID=UPI0013BE8CBC|nr:hypothetical protein [Jeotgalibacillus soli]
MQHNTLYVAFVSGFYGSLIALTPPLATYAAQALHHRLCKKMRSFMGVKNNYFTSRTNA